MSKLFDQIKVGLDETLEEQLQWLDPEYGSYRILKKSVDARQNTPFWVYRIETFSKGENRPEISHPVEKLKKTPLEKPIIIGSGPAGLFAALRLIERGVHCRLFEQGSTATQRMKSIAAYWRYGTLDPYNNVCFGEGGAGLYSDGKLITRIKSPFIPYVLNRLVQFGAPEEIQYLSNPHVGSDKIRKVIPPIREFLRNNGCEIYFDTPVKKVLFENHRVKGILLKDGKEVLGTKVVLATGHSSVPIIKSLAQDGVTIEGKSFAVGLRIEHPQKEINKIQYKAYAEHPALGAANYRLAKHDNKTGIGVYSFCMCPGGYVISSGTDSEGVVSNGMSNYKRNSPYANAAIVVSIDHKESFGSDLFAGLTFRQELEEKAKAGVTAQRGSKQLPAQTVMNFLNRRNGDPLPSSTPSGCMALRLDQLLPENVVKNLSQALESFNRSMSGFISPNAQLLGVETRTSCPIRVTRHSQTLQSLSHLGLYPAGEGAGYAGGITSAAVDGVRIAEAIWQEMNG
ncbi:MAG: FAD-binding protein [Deltaproteobacteria bacterium]|nr:FAD-binding protein [Deltaproteobacteria bacterium]